MELSDYVDAEKQPLFVPTMAVTSDLKQVSVRASYMEGAREQQDARFSVCSAEGSAGWSPFMPNTYATSVLEPLMQQDGRGQDVSRFQEFWQKHLGETPLPEVLRVAHGSMFSVLREDILRRPKSFYQALLADVSNSELPHLSLFVENMWWSIFRAGADLCPQDFPSTAAVANNRRKLAPALLVTPALGDDVSFGKVTRISWSSEYVDGTMPWRVEVWKYGSFMTRLASPVYASYFEWLVSPDSAAKDWVSNDIGSGAGTSTRFNLEPGDRYTIRICDGSADASQGYAEQICDESFAESGEFDILPAIDMLEPSCIMSGYTAPANIQAVWQSYYTGGSATITLTVHNSNDDVVYTDAGITDTGYYNFYAPYDMAGGMYRFKVAADCGSSCTNYWMKDAASSVIGTGCWFTVATAASPPSPPANTPLVPYEIPIVKAFESGFNQYGAAAYSANDGLTYQSKDDSAEDCQSVCLAGYGRARKLLFGGLSSSYGINLLTESVMPCTTRAAECNCHFCNGR